MGIPIGPTGRRWPALLLAILAACSGCARGGAPELVVATNWPESACRPFERDVSAPIRWVRFAPGDDPTRAVERRLAVDVVLGGPISSYRRSFAEASWRLARRSVLGWVTDGVSGESIESAGWGDQKSAGRVALDDPRRDPLTLAWMRAQLPPGGWVEGYGRLVALAAQARRIGAVSGSAAADLRRGKSIAVPAVEPGTGGDFVPLPGRPEWAEGVAETGLGRNPSAAREFVARFASPGPLASDTPSSAVESLLADLLGATLIDAQDELWSAREALRRVDRIEPLVRLLSESPPWPPAFIEKLKGGASADPLIGELADQLTDGPEERDWLRASWDRPGRAIDAEFLDELAGAAEGRLAENPRFRAWLRGEWTAWARQRYRRVARRAESEGSRTP